MTTSPAAAEVQVIADGPVAHVRLHRPERLNALRESTFRELRAALRRIGDDDTCRVVVLSGAGRAFSAGLDVEAGLGPRIPEILGVLRVGVETITLLRDIPQPVIAAVGGHAVGAGFALAAACDIRLASADAVFTAPFVGIGMSAGDLGLSWLLPRQVGVSAAARLFYTAGSLGADEALRLGLVSEVARSAEETVAAALELAATIARQPPLGVQETKSVLNSSVYGIGFRAHLEQELRAQALCWSGGGAEIIRARFAARKG
ncbi:enoyl-CoA hydratase/isomerase family protein [Thermopolyspora sp. NPDC052614]|uniref:enoyl-CoA hydratase/isomerase family protein n=1 Tax=Thermopolyspora sp. NPDC052614 TaxID=3155682 RepID=UPI0034407C2B